MSSGKCALAKSLPEARTQNQFLRRCKWKTKDPSARLNSLMNTSEKHRLSDKSGPSGEMDSTRRMIGGTGAMFFVIKYLYLCSLDRVWE